VRGTEDMLHGYLSPFSTTSHSLFSGKSMLFETVVINQDYKVLHKFIPYICL